MKPGFNQNAALALQARGRRMEGRNMVRFVRLLAAAALAAGLAAPAARAQTSGPLEQATPMRAAKPHETTLKKRARRPAHVGRDVTVHARHTPSYLTAGTQVPVGTVGNGYVYDTFNQPTPIEGTFTGMRGRERLTDQFGNAAPGWVLFKF
jgi:Ni/Co efflux regulator RcnB